MDAARLRQIEAGIEVLSREGHEPIFARELLDEVKRLRRSECGPRIGIGYDAVTGESIPPPQPITE